MLRRRRLNPFAGLSQPRAVWAWGMYDLANQSFTLLIVTMFFGVYVQQVVADDPRAGERLWGNLATLGAIGYILLGPMTGAIADARSLKKAFLIATALICGGLTVAFGLLGPGMVLLVAVFYVVASITYKLGESFLASFLPEIARPAEMGRVSATGWAMGYIGALLLLVISGVLIKVFGWSEPQQWRPLFVFAGFWFLLAALPTILFLRERRAQGPPAGSALLGFGRLAQSARESRRFIQLQILMLAFFFYSLGTNTVIHFAGIIMKNLGFSTGKLVVFILVLTIAAGTAAIAAARYQDRAGHRRTVFFFLGVWLASTAGLTVLTALGFGAEGSTAGGPGEWLFWVLAGGTGFGLGGIGTASRALAATFVPVHKTAEFFALWYVVFRLAEAVGPNVFSKVMAYFGLPVSLGLLASFFAAGAAVLLKVDEKAGARAAREAEREAGREPIEPDDIAAAAAAGRPLDTLGEDQSQGQ